MTIKTIQTKCAYSETSPNDIYIEISRIRDGGKIYNSPTGYLNGHQRKGGLSWTERLPKMVDNNDTYLLLCLNKQNFASIKYTSFCPKDFEAEKPSNLNFEVDIYEVVMEVDWE
ncbi:MAG: hypothetical protein ACPG49_05680 [Chitinophagales bacterium]